MDYRLIAEKGEHALIQRGSKMQEYAVVNGLDKDKGEWDYTCSYYGFGKYSKLTEEEALFKALDDFRSRTDSDYIIHERLLEIATLLKDALVEDGADEAYEYMCETMELSEKEAEVLGLDMDEYRRKAGYDEEYIRSSTSGDYGPSHPWDAPGMSRKDFI